MENMIFTYDSYANLILILKKNGYNCTSYYNWDKFDKSVILRHDIDTSIEKAYKFAKLEESIGVKSTYFVLLTSNLYNPFTQKNLDFLKGILAAGHDIGLHFDEMAYPEIVGKSEKVIYQIQKESKQLSENLEIAVKTVSFHRPSKEILNENIEIPGLINSYGKVFFRELKYVSDSRRCWREPVIDIINKKQYNHIHILTHAFWYNDDDISAHDVVTKYVNEANMERYRCMCENISNFTEMMSSDEIIQ